MALRTLSWSAGLTYAEWLMVAETVAIDTPAALATSWIVGMDSAIFSDDLFILFNGETFSETFSTAKSGVSTEIFSL
jgi:hypothetical protein